MNAPWLKFYPSDWRADPALRMCSLAARGLWMEMLCLMHEAVPRGSLLVNGQVVTDKQLAALCGVSARDVVTCLAQLQAAGVFSLEDNRTIYSRRMRRDQEKAERDKANGKAGGNPTLKAGVNPPDKAQILDARDQKESKIPADAGPPSKSTEYQFEYGVIRLTKKHFSAWEKAYSYLDLRAELIGLSQWAGEQSNWFCAVPGLLAKRNREAKKQIDLAKQGGPQLPLTRAGNPWPEGIV
jgi:alkylated DNA nucleotide flippase Atl1